MRLLNSKDLGVRLGVFATLDEFSTLPKALVDEVRKMQSDDNADVRKSANQLLSKSKSD